MLIREAQTDPAAFGALYQRYFARVYWYLRACTETTEDAGDLTQQVFLQALEALPAYRARGAPFAAWLFRIARNAAINFSRRQLRTVPWSSLPTIPFPTMPDPEAQALLRDDLRRLGDLVAELEPDKRELLALRFAGLTARETAAVVGKSEAAVKKQLARTLQSLKERYHAQ